MFSKALFKQSCKANRTMWIIITFAVCFMLACVMLISGGGNIGNIKNAVEDTIITGEIDASLQKRAINYYGISTDALGTFDGYFVNNFKDASTYDAKVNAWLANQPTNPDGTKSAEQMQQELEAWQNQFPAYTTITEGLYAQNFDAWKNQMPQKTEDVSLEQYQTALNQWKAKQPTGAQNNAKIAYMASASMLKTYEQNKALQINSNYTADTKESKEIVGTAMCALDPTLDQTLQNLYTNNNTTLPQSYDVTSLVNHIASGDINTYLASEERTTYKQDRSQKSSAVFLAGNMTTAENIDALVDALSSYGVTKQKYYTFGYTFDKINHTSQTTIVSYQGRYDYELGLINQKYTPEQYSSEEYKAEVLQMNKNLTADLTNSLLSSLPQSVSIALQEVGQLDLYSLIVGSIFYKMAGLLLPIIYMIMASNNLIAGQVDSGSMAYVLSTSTKRKQVTFTQAVFLIGSLFAMFCCTTITSVVCLAVLNNTSLGLTYGKLVLLNLGAFITMFAMSGICFLASCWFDRSKKSMAIGGGLSMFFLVATMLGLFGSPTIPSVVRLDALNGFNYVSLISLFDAVSIIDGTTTFIWKLVILLAVGVAGYIIGSIKFDKKDLPL